MRRMPDPAYHPDYSMSRRTASKAPIVLTLIGLLLFWGLFIWGIRENFPTFTQIIAGQSNVVNEIGK